MLAERGRTGCSYSDMYVPPGPMTTSGLSASINLEIGHVARPCQTQPAADAARAAALKTVSTPTTINTHT